MFFLVLGKAPDLSHSKIRQKIEKTSGFSFLEHF